MRSSDSVPRRGSEVEPGLELSRDNFTLERASRVLALCGRRQRGVEPFERAGETISGRDADDPRVVAGDRCGARHRARRTGARDSNSGARQAVRSRAVLGVLAAYLRGQAYLQLKDGERPASEFQSILDHRGEVPASMLYPLAHLGLARAAVLANNPEKARAAYDAFLALWKDADPDLRPLKDARLEYSRLR